MKSILKIVITSYLLLYTSYLTQAQIYVDADAVGNNDGTSWTDAYVYLQDALAAATSGDEIWVADGTYYPDEGASQTDNSRTEYFTLVSGVSLYGGFNGTETSKYQASPTQSVSVLSGDIDKDGTSDSDNAYHVIYANGLSATVAFSGFTIQHGYADGSSSESEGGGFYNYDNESYLTISDCIFENNYSSNEGGAIKNHGGSTDAMTTTFQNCIFRDNTGKGGGAAYVTVSSGNTINVLFINCLFDTNISTGNGGAIYTYCGSSTTANTYCTNCTFYDNNSSWGGDGVRAGGYANNEFSNCIFWSNGNDEFSNNNNSTATATNCIMDISSLPSYTTDGGNNQYNADPLFEDAANDDFRLQDGSPAIDAGNNQADLDGSGSSNDSIATIAQDLNGLPRLDENNETVDIGAYERPLCDCNHFSGTNAGGNITTGVGNTIYGEEAGVNLTTGSFNSLMGYQAGYNLVNADSSVMMGYQAGFNTTTASKNIFVGAQSGYSNTVGYNNFFIGTKAGYNNTTGYNNIGIGEEAGFTLTTGFNNIIIGENYPTSSTEMTGRDNIFIGNEKDDCTSCSYNIIIGAEDNDLTTGDYNVFYGFGSGKDNSSGIWNTFVGTAAGYNSEYANYNTFIGSYTGWDNNRTYNTDDANYNTYIGDSCGYSNREGEYNVGIGASADADVSTNNTAFNHCTFIGADILYDVSDITLIGYDAQTTGQYSVGIGAYTNIQKIGAIGVGYQSYLNGKYAVGIGYEDTIAANYGIAIGYQSNVADNYGIAIGKNATSSSEYSIALGSGASATGYNAAAIGYGASVSGNHEIVFGNTATTTIGGTVDFTALSDGRFKTNVQEDVVGLDFIRELRPVTYQLTVDGGRQTDARSSLDGNDTFETVSRQPSAVNRYTGFIAQEVEQAAENTNFHFSGIDYRKEIDKYGLRYAEFVVPLVKAVQELQPKIEAQQQVIQQQDAQFDIYKAELLKLAEELKALEKQ